MADQYTNNGRNLNEGERDEVDRKLGEARKKIAEAMSFISGKPRKKIAYCILSMSDETDCAFEHGTLRLDFEHDMTNGHHLLSPVEQIGAYSRMTSLLFSHYMIACAKAGIPFEAAQGIIDHQMDKDTSIILGRAPESGDVTVIRKGKKHGNGSTPEQDRSEGQPEEGK